MRFLFRVDGLIGFLALSDAAGLTTGCFARGSGARTLLDLAERTGAEVSEVTRVVNGFSKSPQAVGNARTGPVAVLLFGLAGTASGVLVLSGLD